MTSHLNDVDVRVAIISADPVVDEDSVVEESEFCNQVDPVEGIVTVPVVTQNRPSPQPLKQSSQRLRSALLDRIYMNIVNITNSLNILCKLCASVVTGVEAEVVDLFYRGDCFRFISTRLFFE